MDDHLLETDNSLLSAEMLSSYTAPEGIYDELHENGELRPIWAEFAKRLENVGSAEINRRWEVSQQLIRENGIVYGANANTSNADRPTRPWELDALPLLIEGKEWRVVESALKQRAHLLELILADLFGPQNLIKNGPLPAEFLFANPMNWRALQDCPPSGENYLDLYAADMARATDGSWWILGDRCEAPSGVGFALENRIVISRMYPSIFRSCHVERLAPFFKTLQATMHKISPRQRDNPRTVILSEGTASESYFEDAYLARYLGHTLVEGADLTVRNQRLYMKTLGGLLPVDVVFRRADSSGCDPLELEANVRHGVTGMLHAIRAGNVAITNSIGSGLVEAPMLMAFMPRLCQHLLGEKLELPGVATYWCGEKESLNHVLTRLDELTVKRAFRDRRTERRITSELRDMPHDELAKRIKQNPASYVAQERVSRSAVPLWRGGKFDSAYLALRGYVVSSDDGYEVLPGGLARTAVQLGSLETSILDGEGSKDTWVLSDAPVEQVTLLSRSAANVEIRRTGADLSSRVADNVYWLGRYLERSDAAARLLRAVALRLTSETDYHTLPDLPLLVRTMAERGQIEPGFAVAEMRDQLPPIDHFLPSAVVGEDSGSLRSNVQQTLGIASRVRDRLSVDSWRILLSMANRFEELTGGHSDLTAILNVTNDVILDLLAFSGTIMESMTRTHAFRFLDIGRRIERAVQLVQLIQTCFLSTDEYSSELLEATLEIDDSLMTYRSRYTANLQLSAVLDLLLTDETNPRSVAYQLLQLQTHVSQLPRQIDTPQLGSDEKVVMSLVHEIRMLDIAATAELCNFGDHRSLKVLLMKLEKNLPQLSNAISHRYLVHSGPSQHLSDIEPDDVEPIV